MIKNVTILGARESGFGAALLASKKGYNVFVSDINQIDDNAVSYTHLTLPTPPYV